MKQIKLSVEHISKLTEITKYYYKDEYSSFELGKECLFCKTPTDYFFINWYDFVLYNLIFKMNINSKQYFNIVSDYIYIDSGLHPIDYLYDILKNK